MGSNKFRIKKNSSISIADTAIVDKSSRIGRGTTVWNFAQIMYDTSIGENCVIGNGVFIDRRVSIGNNVKIQNKALVYRGVKIEDDCFIGPGACFANDKNPRSGKIRALKAPKWSVGKGASVGASAVILPDVNIGKHAMIGAGAVVTKDVPDHAVVAGNPAKIIGYVCVCGTKMKLTAKGYYCSDCRKARGV